MWSMGMGRQLLLKELYSGMGFAVFEEHALASRVPIYNPLKAGCSFRKSREALGNAQHVANVGVFAAVALASTVCRLRNH